MERVGGLENDLGTMGWCWKGCKAIGDLYRYRGVLRDISMSVVWKRGNTVALQGRGGWAKREL